MLIINRANAHMDGKYNTLKNRPYKLKQFAFFFLKLWIVFLFLNSCSDFNQQTNEKTKRLVDYLTEREQQELKLFFHNIFADEELGYTLFGDKPMSFCFPNTYPPVFSKRTYLFKLYIEGTIPFARGSAAWQKLKSIIGDNSNYSIIIYEEKKYPTFVVLINKNEFIKEVGKNIDAFKRVYGRTITAEQILKKIEDKIIDKDELFNQHLLLGIMLGYGRYSAELFQRRWSLAYGEPPFPFLQSSTTPSDGFSSVEEELKYLTERLQTESKDFEWYTNTCPLFLRVTTVAFAFDPDDSEAQFLIKKYKTLHSRLTDIFDSEDWLETVLNRLAS